MEEGFDQWVDRTTAPAAAEPYRPWGREPAGGPMFDFRREIGTRRHLGGADRRVGTLLPKAALLDVDYDVEPTRRRDSGSDELWFRFAHCEVGVIGYHLDGLRAALGAGAVDFVQVYDAARWPDEPELGEPIVVTIQVDPLPRPEMKRGDEAFLRTLRRGRR